MTRRTAVRSFVNADGMPPVTPPIDDQLEQGSATTPEVRFPDPATAPVLRSEELDRIAVNSALQVEMYQAALPRIAAALDRIAVALEAAAVHDGAITTTGLSVTAGAARGIAAAEPAITTASALAAGMQAGLQPFTAALGAMGERFDNMARAAELSVRDHAARDAHRQARLDAIRAQHGPVAPVSERA